jgi:hypothetical protein
MRAELHFVYYLKERVTALQPLGMLSNFCLSNILLRRQFSRAIRTGAKFGISYNVIYHFRIAITLEILSCTMFQKQLQDEHNHVRLGQLFSRHSSMLLTIPRMPLRRPKRRPIKTSRVQP